MKYPDINIQIKYPNKLLNAVTPLCFLLLLLLHLPPQIPVSRLKFKSQGPNPSTGSPDPNLEAQISALRSKSQPRRLIPTSRLRFGPQG